MTITHEIKADVQKSNTQMVKIPQYSKDTHSLVVTLTNNGKPLTVDSGTHTSKLKIAGPDDNYYYLDMTIDDSTNTVQIILPSSVVGVSGKHNAQINLIETETEAMVCSMPFIISIIASVYDEDAPVAAGKASELKGLVSQANTLLPQLRELISNAALIEIGGYERGDFVEVDNIQWNTKTSARIGDNGRVEQIIVSGSDAPYKMAELSVTPGQLYKVTGVSKGKMKPVIVLYNEEGTVVRDETTGEIIEITTGETDKILTYLPADDDAVDTERTVYIRIPPTAHTLIVNAKADQEGGVALFQSSSNGTYYQYIGRTQSL